MMQIKYELVAIQVEKLYQKQFAEHNEKAISNHVKYIADYINACGWTENDYFERSMKETGN